MFQKIANVLSIISFVMVASMSGGSYFGYKYVTSEQFKSRVMNEILGNVQGMMPKLLDNGLPKMTGPSMPIIKWIAGTVKLNLFGVEIMIWMVKIIQ